MRLWSLLVSPLALMLIVDLAGADPAILEDGVLIAHHPPGLEFTSGQDWCDRYEQEFAIDSCAEQSNRIDLNGYQGDGSVWYVLAAWGEAKDWCAVEFGLGAYTAANYAFVEHGPCGSGALTIPTSGWPGPGEGISIAVPADEPWSGSFVPVYFFAGYAYGEDLIPLSIDPAQNFAGFSSCATPPDTWTATALGGMGIFREGAYSCYPGGEGLDGGEDSPPGDIDYGPPEVSEDCLPDVVLIRFAPNVVSFPNDDPERREHFRVPFSEAEFAHAVLRSQLMQLGAESFETIAPNWRHMTEDDEIDIHGRPVDLIDFTNVYRVTLDGRASVQDAIDRLWEWPEVEYVECDLAGFPLAFPEDLNDPYYPCQWYLDFSVVDSCGSDTCSTEPNFSINAPEAWVLHDSAGTKIGISDRHIHRAIAGFSEYIDTTLSRSFVEGPWWTDSPGQHGTKVASIAAAGADDGLPLASVPNLPANRNDSLVVALRVDAQVAAGVSALSYVCSEEVAGRIAVVNHSWGHPSCKLDRQYSSALLHAFRNAFLRGISLVCASGNSVACDPACGPADTCFAYPAAFYDYALATAAVDCEGQLESTFKVGSYIDLSAPGADICYLPGDGVTCEDQIWTSYSAPIASGAIALMLGADPALTNEDCYQILRLTARTIPGAASIEAGAGLLDVGRAIELVVPPRGVRHGTTTDFVDIEEGAWEATIVIPLMGGPTPVWVEAHRLLFTSTIAGSGVLDQVWVRGATCTGWRRIDESIDWYYDPDFYANHAAVVSRHGRTVTFATYTYEVFDEDYEEFLGWFPVQPGAQPCSLTYSYVLNSNPSGVGGSRESGLTGLPRLSVWEERGETIFGFALGTTMSFDISIYDLNGRLVRVLPSSAGKRSESVSVRWNRRNAAGEPVPSGIYFARPSFSGRWRANTGPVTRVLVVR